MRLLNSALLTHWIGQMAMCNKRYVIASLYLKYLHYLSETDHLPCMWFLLLGKAIWVAGCPKLRTYQISRWS